MTNIKIEEYKKILRSVQNNLKSMNMQQEEFKVSEVDINRNKLEKKIMELDYFLLSIETMNLITIILINNDDIKSCITSSMFSLLVMFYILSTALAHKHNVDKFDKKVSSIEESKKIKECNEKNISKIENTMDFLNSISEEEMEKYLSYKI